MYLSEKRSIEVIEFLENEGFVVERIHAPMQFREDLGIGITRFVRREAKKNLLELFKDVTDVIFFKGIYKTSKYPEIEYIEFILASHFIDERSPQMNELKV